MTPYQRLLTSVIELADDKISVSLSEDGWTATCGDVISSKQLTEDTAIEQCAILVIKEKLSC